MSDLKEIPIRNKTTGKLSSGKTLKAQIPEKNNSSDQPRSYQLELPGSLINNEDIKSKSNSVDNDIETCNSENDEQKKKDKKSKKNLQTEIQSLAQYIEFAYSRKGQRISLPPKVEKALYKNYLIDSETKSRLLKLAESDILLAVPRQLLLVSRSIVGHPQVKKELKDFIELALKNHFIFSQNDLSAALNNLPSSPSPQEALNKVAKTNLSSSEEYPLTYHFKSTDQDILRANAAYCLAIWFAEFRGYQAEQITKMLYTALWKPDNPEFTDATKLRVLTEIRELNSVGLACSIFKKETDKQEAIAVSALRNQETLSNKVRLLELEIIRIKNEQKESDLKIQKLENELINEKDIHAHSRVHLADDKEQLRARFLRRIKNEASLLEEGLHALRRTPPKTHVMDDHAERVLEGLYTEIKDLESGN